MLCSCVGIRPILLKHTTYLTTNSIKKNQSLSSFCSVSHCKRTTVFTLKFYCRSKSKSCETNTKNQNTNKNVEWKKRIVWLLLMWKFCKMKKKENNNHVAKCCALWTMSIIFHFGRSRSTPYSSIRIWQLYFVCHSYFTSCQFMTLGDHFTWNATQSIRCLNSGWNEGVVMWLWVLRSDSKHHSGYERHI